MEAHKPPFPLLNKGGGLSTPYKGGKWQILKFPEGISDGSSSHLPRGPPYRLANQGNYLYQLAQSWAIQKSFAAPFTNYYLDRLPDGYGFYEMDKPGDTSVQYKRLFGHPNGKFYDSIRRFEPHFMWLIDGRKGICECVVCGNVKPIAGPPRKKMPSTSKVTIRERRPRVGRPPRHPSDDDLTESHRSQSAGAATTERTRRFARQPATAHPTDEEGTKHVWRDAIVRLKNAEHSIRGIEIDIKEEDSIDWITERDILKNHLTQIELQHSFIPRRGELVLWTADVPPHLHIIRDPRTMAYRLYDFRAKKYAGIPNWRGGVVTDIPSAASKNGNIDFPDILDLPEKTTSWNTAGFRIETMPDPNDDLDKSFSKQYKYVPLRNIRPLSHWQLLLRGISQTDLHPSILYALTCMTSISLVGKWRFNGSWPAGQIMAKAMYLGSELITIGDTVRLLPTSATTCSEVLVVESIRLALDNILPQHLDNKSTQLCSHSVVTLTGQAYTIKMEDAYNPVSTHELKDDKVMPSSPLKPEIVKIIFRPVGTGDYGEYDREGEHAENGKWYPLHGPNDRLQVSYDQVLGRLHEADAIRLWSGQRQVSSNVKDPMMKPDLGFDMASIIAGRQYATKTDERLPDLPVDDPNGIRWLISDTRVQALALASVNSLDVGPYHDIRDPKTLASWRAYIRHANGEQMSSELLADMQVKKQRPSHHWTNNYASTTDVLAATDGFVKKRGRPTGSRLINGKVYTAQELADMTDAEKEKLRSEAKHATPDKKRTTQVGTVVTEGEEEDDDVDELETIEVQLQPTSPQRYRSRMAGAALISSDEEDSADSRTESHAENDDELFKLKLAAYGTASDDEEAVIDLEDQDREMDVESNTADLSAWQSKETTVVQKRPLLTKSQIMESVGKGHDMMTSVQAYDYDDEYEDDQEEEEEEEFDLEEWKNPRNARGGTEESEGGDYEPGESQ